MRMSTKGRYGLRAMFELACQTDAGPVTVAAVAQRQELSRKHLHTLLTALKSAGLVHSVRGPGGGFALARAPERIRLSEILEAVEGPLTLAPLRGGAQPVPQDCALPRSPRLATSQRRRPGSAGWCHLAGHDDARPGRLR